MSKLGVRFIELNPSSIDAITSMHIYYDGYKTIYDKIREIEAGNVNIIEIDGGSATD
ncbi:MAG: hypothetical protein QXD03_02385 [Candidatus Anstonellales archaeon]